MNKHIEVVIIDDDIKQTDPLIVVLSEENSIVKLFNVPEEGLAYVNDNLEKRMVVVLDIMFGKSALNGHLIFHRIREQSHLIPVIIHSAGQLGRGMESKPILSEGSGIKDTSIVTTENLVDFVNEHAFAYLRKPVSFEKMESIIKRAVKSVEARLDSVIQEWVLKHPREMRDKPYLSTVDGRTLNLNDVLENVRQQTAEGKQFETQLLNLTIDMLMRGKKNL